MWAYDTTAGLLADDGDHIELPFVLPTGLIAGGVIALSFLVGLLAVAGWWAWRRLRRSRLVERGMLQVRARALPAGPQREIADLLPRLQQTTTGLDAHL